MRSAELSYRSYVPYRWLAIEFCSLEFHGDDKGQRRWHEIKFEKYREAEPKIKEVEATIASEKSKTYKWHELQRKHQGAVRLAELERQLKKLEKSRWKGVYELLGEAKELLVSLGYTLQSKTTDGSECTTYYEVWVKAQPRKDERGTE